MRAVRARGLLQIGASHELAVTSVGLERRRLETGRVDRTAALQTADAAAVAGGAVWVATSSDELYRLDPRTLRVTLGVPLV